MKSKNPIFRILDDKSKLRNPSKIPRKILSNETKIK